MLTVAIPKRNKLQNIIVLTPKDGAFCLRGRGGRNQPENGPQASENLRRRPSGNRRKRGRFMGADKTGGKGKKP